jgi:signal transduction histidine kinase
MFTRNSWIIIALSVCLAIAVGVIVFQARKRKSYIGIREEVHRAEREAIIQRAVTAERARILREMHDIIAHSLAIMIAQADGGTYVVSDPDAARRTFATIADTGRTAVDETKRVLGMLKPDADSAVLTPVPDESSLDDLVKRARTSGLDAYLVRLGEPRSLPSGVGLALYRIAQEALTNAMKHAGEGARVTLIENWRAGDVVLTITDADGRKETKNESGLGQGLISMKERAATVGATLTAGPYEEGFRVRAVLPLPKNE